MDHLLDRLLVACSPRHIEHRSWRAILAAGLWLPILATAGEAPGVQLNGLFFASGDPVSASLIVPSPRRDDMELGRVVALVTEASGDIELLSVRDTDAAISFDTRLPVVIGGGDAKVRDGRLQLAKDERFFAFLYWRHGRILKTAMAVGSRLPTSSPSVRINKELANLQRQQGDEGIGYIAGDAALARFGIDHLVYFPRSKDEAARLVRQVRGSLTEPKARQAAHVLKFDPKRLRHCTLQSVLQLLGADHIPTVGSDAAAAMYGAALCLQMQGYRVDVDPVVQWGAPEFRTQDLNTYSTGDFLSSSMTAQPGMRDAWLYAWMFDYNRNRTNVAIVDQGFAPNYDFRGLLQNQIWQCDFADHEPEDPTACAFGGAHGKAAAPQTVGSGLVGNMKWHGNGVATAALGLINNRFGGGGAGGQVGVPMLYRVDFRSYALQLSDVIRKATSDGAAVINISAGYPCRIFKTYGTAYEICNAEGRAGLLVSLSASAIPLAVSTCGFFPFVCLGAAINYDLAEITSLIVEVGETDLRMLIEDAVKEAAQQGVTVVSIAGNVMSGNTDGGRVLCAITDCGNHDADQLQIIPCVVRMVLCVGAAAPSTSDRTTFHSTEFKGMSVDVWAMTNHPYMVPPQTNQLTPPSTQTSHQLVGATSGAAPIVTGTIALLQTTRPDLNLRNPALGPLDRAAIPAKIEKLITDSARHVQDSLDPTLQLRILDPYAALRAATAGIVPDPTLLGSAQWSHDLDLVSDSDACSTPDTGIPVKAMSGGESCGGSIVTIDAERGMPGDDTHALKRIDVDIVGWKVPSPADVPANGRFSTTVTLTTAYRGMFGLVGVGGDAGTLVYASASDATETYVYETLPHFRGVTAPITIRGRQDSDNVYRLGIGQPTRLSDLDRDRFDVADTHPSGYASNDTPQMAADVGAGVAPTDPDGWSSDTIIAANLTFHSPSDRDWLHIMNLPRARNRCGRMLVASAPYDIQVAIRHVLGSVLIAGKPSDITHTVERRNFASISLDDAALSNFSVGFWSPSHAALEYDATVALWSWGDQICEIAKQRRLYLIPFPHGIGRWSPATVRDQEGRIVSVGKGRSPALVFDHNGGPLRVEGRLFDGTLSGVSLIDPHGEQLSRREIGSEDLDSTTRGGATFDASLPNAAAGRWLLALDGVTAATDIALDFRSWGTGASGKGQ